MLFKWSGIIWGCGNKYSNTLYKPVFLINFQKCLTHIHWEGHDKLAIHGECVPECYATEPSHCQTDLSLGCSICSKPNLMCSHTGKSGH